MPQRAVQTARLLGSLRALVPQQSEQKPQVEKNVSQRNLWVWLLPNGVNCSEDSEETHSVQNN